MSRLSGLTGMNPRKRKNKRKRLYERDGGICQICFKPVGFEEFSVDHYPVKKRDGGTNHDSNLRIAHIECNWEIEKSTTKVRTAFSLRMQESALQQNIRKIRHARWKALAELNENEWEEYRQLIRDYAAENSKTK